MSLKDRLSDWVDADGAAYSLALELGVFDQGIPFGEVKYLFWTVNPVGDGLHAALLVLVEAGVLEMRDDHAFRWSPGFAVKAVQTLRESAEG
ncbi:hypothetical protein ACFQO7_09225 [Catellatospora aurea]|uniref:Uncharacterized protein n=1 Tax=Catellatospora aurea TaxID=1337874 RepID=A0ABW2GRT2_9ACTN